MGRNIGLIGIIMAAIAILLLPNVWAEADAAPKVACIVQTAGNDQQC